jgi:CheY-like chemotaxis protein
VDEVQLEQVILNLAVNARDAMPAGGVLTITTAIGVPEESVVMNHGDAADRVFVKLTVTDTGVGMARNVMGDIFTPFFTTKREGVGTGLGLAIVQGIIRDAGGFIDVQSEIGRGSSFSVHLPLAGGSPDAVVEPPDAADVVDVSGGTILFVEDDQQIRNMAARALRLQGFRVLTAENGAEALQLADEHETIDLLLTDVVLPDAGGAALAQALRSLRPNLKVLYTSGYAEVEELFGQPELNREAFVRKPWTPLELARHVRHLLEATS